MPSFSVVVAFPVPTMQGTPSSLLTIAAWLVIPPVSVMMAEAFFMPGTKSGVVISVTSTSPRSMFLISLADFSIMTLPMPTPGEAPRPFSRIWSAPIPALSGLL